MWRGDAVESDTVGCDFVGNEIMQSDEVESDVVWCDVVNNDLVIDGLESACEMCCGPSLKKFKLYW